VSTFMSGSKTEWHGPERDRTQEFFNGKVNPEPPCERFAGMARKNKSAP
jgi:hypothetical protein